MSIPYAAVITTPGDDDLIVPVESFSVSEVRGAGWFGIARLDFGASDAPFASSAAALRTVIDFRLVPGKPIVLRLVMAGDTMGGTPVRNWPSMIMRVVSVPRGKSEERGLECRVELCDPLSYCRTRPVWGVFNSCSPGQMVGGALSLAVGGNGDPTREPVLPGMPVVRIYEHVRAELEEIPYAIATGEPLRSWLDRILGTLGIRMELVGFEGEQVGIRLRDTPPSASEANENLSPIEMIVDGSAEPGATTLSIVHMQINALAKKRSALFDSPSQGAVTRIGSESGSVEAVIRASEIDVVEAGLRAGFARESAVLATERLWATSANPGMLPGRLVDFVSSSAGGAGTGSPTVMGASRWQLGDVKHFHVRGKYRNIVEMEKAGTAWRPPVPRDGSPVAVSGTVDDGVSQKGDSVPRDNVGRIPVTLSFLPRTDEDQTPADSGASASPAGRQSPRQSPQQSPVQVSPISLPVIGLMAGDTHGFVTAHRQGDICRVLVFNPLYAEIHGFGYGDDRRVAEKLSDASAGLVVRHGEGGWRGIVFRPQEDMGTEQDDNDD